MSRLQSRRMKLTYNRQSVSLSRDKKFSQRLLFLVPRQIFKFPSFLELTRNIKILISNEIQTSHNLILQTVYNMLKLI